jgi:hypothetical protein
MTSTRASPRNRPHEDQTKPLMRCFTDEELVRGIEAVIAGHGRCRVCGDENVDEHDELPHPFVAPDPLDVFLAAARSEDSAF